MATHRIDILGGSVAPDTSGLVYPDIYTVAATNDFWGPKVWVFTQGGSTKFGIHGVFEVPQNYVGTPIFSIVWTSTAITGDVEWEIDYRTVGGNDTESLDQATAEENLNNNNDTAPSATDERMEYEITPSANFSAGDTVEWILSRDETDAGDTMAASAYLFGFYFKYNDA